MSEKFEETIVIPRWQFDITNREVVKNGSKPVGGLEKWLREVCNVVVEPKPKIQAKHIPDAMMLTVVKQLEGIPYMHAWPGGITIYEPKPHATVSITDICNLYPRIPPKVILAKLRSLEKRGLIDGCAHRHMCRGDFKVIVKKTA